MSFLGVTGMGLFLSLLIMVNYGTDPYTFMNRSIAARIGWSLGNWQLLINLALLVLVIAADRSLIGFGTIFNMVLVGYYADFFTWLWDRVLPGRLFTEQPARAVIFAVALIGFVVSAAIYMNADAGLSPCDASAKLLANRFSRAPFFIMRMIFDFTTIAVGALFGGRPTISIFLIAIFLGPVITIVGRLMSGRSRADR